MVGFRAQTGGLFVFNPTVTVDNSWWYRGTADAMYQNINFLKKRHEPYVIITSGDCIYKLDYNKVLDYHIEKKADITVVCKDMAPGEDVSRYGVVRMNEDSKNCRVRGKTDGIQVEHGIDRNLYRAQKTAH